MRIMFYDTTAGWLSKIWFLGGILFSFLGLIDVRKGFSDWNTALDWLIEITDGDIDVDCIQYWGHGCVGGAVMSGFILGPSHEAKMKRLSRNLNETSSVWLRVCSCFAGEAGYFYAKYLTSVLNCRVAGSTHIIHLIHSGVYSLTPGQEPYWPRDDGILRDAQGNLITKANGNPKTKISKPWSDRSLLFLRSKLPSTW